MGLQGVIEGFVGLAGVFVWVGRFSGLERILEHVFVSSLVSRYWNATLLILMRVTLLSFV